MRQRESIYDLMRVAAAYFVVTVHVSVDYLYLGTIGSNAWVSAFTYDSLAHVFVPLFFMISGRFFLDPQRIITGEKVLQKSGRLLAAFFVWSFLYLLVFFLPSYQGMESIRSNLGWLAERFIRGGSHLWFLWALLGLYLITPILRQVVLNKTASKWFVVLFLVFQILLPALHQVPLIGNLIVVAENTMKLHFVLGYTGYYLLGYLLHEYQLKKSGRVTVYLFGVVCFVLCILLSVRRSVSEGVVYAGLLDYLHPFIIAPSIALYLGAISISRDNPKLGQHRVISFLSAYSFGIYLVHLMVFKLFQAKDLLWWAHPIIAIPVDAIVIMAISCMLTWLIRRIPYIGKLIT